MDWTHVMVHIHYFVEKGVIWYILRIVLERIDVNYPYFDTGEVNFKCVMLGIFEGAYKNLHWALALYGYFAVGQW